MTEIRSRASLPGVGDTDAEGSAVRGVVDREDETVAEIRHRETLSEVGATDADRSQSADDTLTRVKRLMAEPPTAKSARP